MIQGIVQLGKSVGQFAANNEQLETINHLGILVIFARQGRNFGGIFRNKSRLPKFGFNNHIKDFGEQLARADIFVRREPKFFGISPQGFEVVEHCHIDGAIFNDGFFQSQAFPGGGQIDLFAAVADFQAAADILRHMTDELFGVIHQVVIGGIGPVKFHHGKFGVVLNGDALVAEVAVDLEHAIKAADNQALEIKFRRNPQKKIHIQGIVMGHKRPCRCAARHRMHHGCFNFKIVVIQHVLPNKADNAAALAKQIPDFGIGDQVEITLAIAGFNIGEAVPFFRQRQQ